MTKVVFKIERPFLEILKPDTSSFEVFPLYNNGKLYGAIQNGIHHFYLREENKEDLHTSTARFTTVWIKEADKWIISNVLSFDHKDPPDEDNK